MIHGNDKKHEVLALHNTDIKKLPLFLAFVLGKRPVPALGETERPNSNDSLSVVCLSPISSTFSP
jgi:hypothetical protein